MKRNFLLLIVLLAFAPAAHAENTPVIVPVNGVDVNVMPPEGACAYDRANPADAQVLDMLEKGNQAYNKVVLAFVNCADKDSLRAGKQSPATGDYGQVLSPLSAQDAQNVSRAELVGKMTDFYRTNTGVFEEGTQKAKEIMQSLSNGGLSLSGSNMLGVVKAEPDLVEVGMVQSLHYGDKTMTLAGIISVTKLGVPVSINLYCPYTGEASLNALADRAALYTRRLIALNPDTPGAGGGFNYHEALTGTIIGALVGGMLAIFLKFAKKRNAPK